MPDDREDGAPDGDDRAFDATPVGEARGESPQKPDQPPETPVERSGGNDAPTNGAATNGDGGA